MAQVIIESITYSKNPTNVNDTIIITVQAKRQYEEVITTSLNTLVGVYNCGQILIKEEILIP